MMFLFFTSLLQSYLLVIFINLKITKYIEGLKEIHHLF